MSRGERRIRLLGALAAVCWLLAGIAGLIRWMAGDAGLLQREMLRWAPPAASGLPEEAYAGVARMTADYLTGRTERFQYEWITPAGETVACFQPHEAAHMADCRGLITLAGRVALGALAAAAACSAAGFRRQGRRAFARGLLRGLAGAGLLAAALVAWALADFDGLFVTFHRVAFSNDGWLLDPRTDLLIRLMPTNFFVALGIRGLIRALVIPTGLGLAAGWMLRRNGERTAHEL